MLLAGTGATLSQESARRAARVTAAPATATMVAVRTFNTVGSVRAERHYQIASLSWIDLDEVLGLIRDERYFVLHAPRQTGKTSALLALRDRLNVGAAGDFRCLYANVENGQAMRENVAEGMRTVLGELAYQASVTLGDETLEELWHALLVRVGRAQALARWRMARVRWCSRSTRSTRWWATRCCRGCGNCAPGT